MDKKVVDIQGKINEKNSKVNHEAAREHTRSMTILVSYKLQVIGITKTYDELDILEALIDSFGTIASDMEVAAQLDRENPPYLAKLKLYDMICNEAVSRLIRL